jgi:hypothetical protein
MFCGFIVIYMYVDENMVIEKYKINNKTVTTVHNHRNVAIEKYKINNKTVTTVHNHRSLLPSYNKLLLKEPSHQFRFASKLYGSIGLVWGL